MSFFRPARRDSIIRRPRFSLRGDRYADGELSELSNQFFQFSATSISSHNLGGRFVSLDRLGFLFRWLRRDCIVAAHAEQDFLRSGGAAGLSWRLWRVLQIGQHQIAPVLRILRSEEHTSE